MGSVLRAPWESPAVEGKQEQDRHREKAAGTRSLGGLSWPHGGTLGLGRASELSPSGVRARQASPASQSVDVGSPGGAVT